MKHKKYICTNCQEETKHARPVDGMLLCTQCHIYFNQGIMDIRTKDKTLN